jgi:hypothetical protein
LNNRGQFSIIAALLVSIVLVSTVIITYSMILSNSIQVQPQVLTAIDETNFAIKQLLGFSVGYYGSVIQVTGDNSFANQSTWNYTTSGLGYVANTHAAWGAGFSLTNLTIHTYWFNGTSCSTGYLAVTYNLTKLGIYGMQYAPSCGLTVQIINTTTTNQTTLTVTQDQNQPVTDLMGQNFMFFKYINSTWQLNCPSINPVAYANGTYQIQPPAGIDISSYVVQVEDQRGIIVVASRASSYAMNLTWTSVSSTTLYAHQETTNVNGTNYYNLLSQNPDASGLTLSSPMSSSRTLFGKFIYGLQGTSTIPANTWTMYYRAWQDSAIALDSVGSGSTGSLSTNKITWSHTTSSGTNRILVVSVSIRPASVSVSSITYGSQSLLPITANYETGGNIRSELWYLTGPSSGTNTITVNLSGNADGATGGSCTYTGVSQTGPIDAFNGGFGTSSTPSQNVVVNTANSLLLGVVAIRRQSNTVSSEGSGQTPRWDNSTSGSSTCRGHGSDEGPDAAGSQSMSWNLSGSTDWAVSVVALKPASTAAGYASVDVLIRRADGSIRTPIATDVAPSGSLLSFPTTLSGTYSWSPYTVVNQTDYLEIDYYVDVTTAGPFNAHLVVDNQTLAIGDQTRLTGLNLPNLPSSSAPDTITIELLQNGTLRWLGRSLSMTTQAMPIPPLPVKSIHVNQTMNGVDSEVPFQIEDWSPDYLIPMGLTSNLSVFNNGNMIVFLVNTNVSKVTVWWNGSDVATQTPWAYVDRYFTGDTPSTGTLTNGILTLQFGGSFTLTSSVGTSSCTATFMRVNNQASTYGASPAYIIYNGVVRDIVQQEAEWTFQNNGCPNIYSHIVVTLPANATYYTYELRVLFVQSSQSRTITDMCPIELQTSITQTQTENGTTGCPIVSTATGTFYNQSTTWAHHWSQLISGTNGAGIMFTDAGNNELYIFDNLAGTQTGGLRVNSNAGTIELLPVEMAPVSFTYALNTIWWGAVSTFSGTTPIYQLTGGQVSGSWISVEYPPTAAMYTGG